MIADSVYFRGYRCFNNDWCGFDTIKPINVIIGRNNTGKSHLLELAEGLCQNKFTSRGWRLLCHGILDESSLKPYFPEGTSGGDLGGNFWSHGKLLVGGSVAWEINEQLDVEDVSCQNGFDYKVPDNAKITNARLERIRDTLKQFKHKLSGSVFRRLLADRDIRTEPPSNDLRLADDGSGATNIIRRFIVTADSRFHRETIQHSLLAALNEVFASDGHFNEIEVKEHDELKVDAVNRPVRQGDWEIYLGEEGKGLIPLSSSGSGLKTVILVLLNLLVIPEIEKKPRSGYTFAFEELENNLHPALVRRLLRFLEDYAIRERATIFLTTHSSTALDIFGPSPNAQLIHVTHDGESARATTVSAHFDRVGVVFELGARPSDLLQANGIVWVEGPSDRVYLNRWITLFSDGTLQEGRDYQCAFYGGALLARTQFSSPEEANSELTNLLRVNSNIVVVCDGDRTSQSGEGSQIKPRVARIKTEVEKIPGAHVWITEAKEIENYLPGTVLGKIFDLKDVPDPIQYDSFFASDSAENKGTSFVETHLKRKTIDKIELAVQAATLMDKPVMENRFELGSQIGQIVKRIKDWNK